MNEKQMMDQSRNVNDSSVEKQQIRWLSPAVDIYEVDDA